jgi:small basic protein (TIGR04137 family)
MLHTPSAPNGSGFIINELELESRILLMSQHRSLRAAATLGGKRNVMKRFERVEVLKKRGEWKAGDRITGLRKTKKEA